jgi:hypothetical protein
MSDTAPTPGDWIDVQPYVDKYRNFKSVCEEEQPIGHWRGLTYCVIELNLRQQLKDLPRPQQSDLIIRSLCEMCRDIIKCRSFWAYINRDPANRWSEMIFTWALASVEPDDFIKSVHEAFPDDDFPAGRLNPFLHDEAVHDWS